MKSLEKIIQTLIINGTLTDQPGLFYGKTGIAVFFFHYARHTDNELFQNYAMDLIEEIQKQIAVTSSARYDVGLAGIGSCFEYLLQNDFLEADRSDIFEDFDARMYRAAMYEPYPDLSLQEGLIGWGRYFIYRLQGKAQKNDKLYEALTHIVEEIVQKIAENTVPENNQPDVCRFLYDLVKLPAYTERYCGALQRCKEWECICKPDVQKLFSYMNNLQQLYACQNYFNMDLAEEIENEWKKWEEPDNDVLMDMGLVKGWATEGLLHLTSINKHEHQWALLL